MKYSTELPRFSRYIGIDYSGAKTADSGLKGIRVYLAEQGTSPVEVSPLYGSSKYWTRRALAEWLINLLRGNDSVMVGMDYSFSFPLQYFEMHGIKKNWTSFLKDFQMHWPTDNENISVDSIRRAPDEKGRVRSGDSHWRRITERRSGAKSVFHFDVPGSVAKSAHAGIPWLSRIRSQFNQTVHFWPFDGWNISPGKSAVFEIYPSMWNMLYENKDMTPDQHDAYTACAWLRDTDISGSLSKYLEPVLTEEEKHIAEFEGWILGVM